MTHDADETSVSERLRAAQTAASAKRFDEAEAILLPILEVDPDNLKALDLLGFVRFFQKRYKECEALCKRALAIKPDHAYAQSGLGMALARQGQIDEGILSLKRAMTRSPAWPEPYWDAAVILIEALRFDDAREILENGIRSAPKAAARFHALLSKIADRVGK